jgi:hypothetical protein
LYRSLGQEVSSDEIEKEFWRILSSPDESVNVEYGADLHTLETGSGFPTKSYKGKLTSNNQVCILIFYFYSKNKSKN